MKPSVHRAFLSFLSSLLGHFSVFFFSFRRVISVPHLARTLSLVVALADTVAALYSAGRVAATRTASGITVVALGTSLASESIVADSARALALMVALRTRGAEGAGTGPTANMWYQVPGAGPAPIAVLAVGQAGTHAATGVGIAHVAESHARVTHYKVYVGVSLFL